MRKTFEETVSHLRALGLVSDTEQPRIPDAMPQFDDEEPCGIGLFRAGLEELSLAGLEMPRSFVSRSEVVDCDFSGTNLAESNLCWSDFIDVDFSGADLHAADLRNTVFERADFTDADLSNADLRHSDLLDCTLTGARLAGAKLGTVIKEQLQLSDEQRRSVDWQEDEGEEAPGG